MMNPPICSAQADATKIVIVMAPEDAHRPVTAENVLTLPMPIQTPTTLMIALSVTSLA